MHAFLAGIASGTVVTSLIFAFRHAIITLAQAEWQKANAKITAAAPDAPAAPAAPSSPTPPAGS